MQQVVACHGSPSMAHGASSPKRGLAEVAIRHASCNSDHMAHHLPPSLAHSAGALLLGAMMGLPACSSKDHGDASASGGQSDWGAHDGVGGGGHAGSDTAGRAGSAGQGESDNPYGVGGAITNGESGMSGDPGSSLEGETGFLSYVVGIDARTGSGGATGSGGMPAYMGGAPSNVPVGKAISQHDAARALSEADTIQAEGDTFLALSQGSGLSIIDASDPAALRVMATYQRPGTPFEMYLEDGIVYIVYSVRDEAISTGSEYTLTTRVQALDISDSTSPVELGHVDLQGAAQEWRKLGNTLYVVTARGNACAVCDDVPQTFVGSFDVSDPTTFQPVDEETFENTASTQSVSVSEERLYVATQRSQSDGTYVHGVQVVDISDPGGQMELGALVEVAGMIDHPSNIDEYDGTLRILSGYSPSSLLETFAIASSAEFLPLAGLPLTLPRDAPLASLRFDGEHAIARTNDPGAPLVTLDLSDPASPAQAGEVQMEGSLSHVESRGDRLYALGFDDSAEEGPFYVSLYDMTDLTQPAQLDRVSFGTEGGWPTTHRSEVRRAFDLLLDAELILVPFYGRVYDEEDCHETVGSGIQLIDASGDELTVRGVAPQEGFAHRTVIQAGLLFGVSDAGVQSFDLSDHDAPLPIGDVATRREVFEVKRLGDELLRFSKDPWTEEQELDLVAFANAESSEPATLLDLSRLGPLGRRECPAGGDVRVNNTTFAGLVFEDGDYAFLPRYLDEWTYETMAETRTLRVAVLALADNGDHQVVSDLPIERVTTVGDGEERYTGIEQSESALLVGRAQYEYSSAASEWLPSAFAYDVIATGAGADAQVVSRIEIPEPLATNGWGSAPEDLGCSRDAHTNWGSCGLVVSGDILASHHAEPVDDGSGRVRYYLDRVDVSDPAAPTLLEPINIPGKMVHYDHDRSWAVTVEDVPEVLSDITGHAPCEEYGRGAVWQYDQAALIANDYDHQATPALCVRWTHRLHVITIEGIAARVLQAMDLRDDGGGTNRRAISLAFSDSRVFLLDGADEEGMSMPVDLQLTAFEVASNGTLRSLGSTPAAWGHLYARGRRAFVMGENLDVVTSPDGAAPTVTQYEAVDYCSIEVIDDAAFCTGTYDAAQYGVRYIPLE